MFQRVRKKVGGFQVSCGESALLGVGFQTRPYN